MKKNLLLCLFFALLLFGCSPQYVQVTVETINQVVATNFYTLSIRDNQSNTLYSLEIRPALYGFSFGSLKAEANQSLGVMLKIAPALYKSTNFDEQKIELSLNEKKLSPSQTWHYANSMHVFFENVDIKNVHAVFKFSYN